MRGILLANIIHRPHEHVSVEFKLRRYMLSCKALIVTQVQINEDGESGICDSPIKTIRIMINKKPVPFQSLHLTNARQLMPKLICLSRKRLNKLVVITKNHSKDYFSG